MPESMTTEQLRCRAQVWERGWPRAHQCLNRAKATRVLMGSGGVMEELAVCGVHARSKYEPGAYFRGRGAYEAAVVLLMLP